VLVSALFNRSCEPFPSLDERFIMVKVIYLPAAPINPSACWGATLVVVVVVVVVVVSLVV
jgi:hypothetical protein